MSDKSLTRERLCELFSYDPETGIFTRISAHYRYAHLIGKPAGCDNGIGYRQLRIDGSLYYCHRLVWLYQFGEWPRLHIDHINGDRSDNRLSNLRDVPRATNLQNRHGPAINNKVGVVGVMRGKRRNTFVAQIAIDGRSTHLGTFSSPEEAHAAYVEAKRRLHAGCTL